MRAKDKFCLQQGKLVILALLFLTLAGCSGGDWQEFRSPQKGFAAYFPGAPQESASSGQQLLMSYKTASYEVSDRWLIFNLQYRVDVTDYTHALSFGQPLTWDNKKAYDGFRDALLKSVDGKIKFDRDIEIAGRSAREFQVSCNKGLITCRLLRKEDRLYTMAVVHPEWLDFKEEKEGFFGNFRLLD